MRQKKSAFQAASPWLSAVYLILSTWLGWTLIYSLASMDGGALHTVPLLISLAIAAVIQYFVFQAGILFFGLFTGKTLVMMRKGSLCNVKEGKRYVLRENSLESSLTPFVMASPGVDSNSGFYLAGGVIGNLFVILISLLLVMSGLVRASSRTGGFFLALILAGIWSIAFNFLPAYHGKEMNTGLKVMTLLKDAKAAYSFDQNMRFVYHLSTGHLEKACQIDYPDLEEDEDDEPMSMFRASYLMRVYEVLVWAEQWDDASEILATVYAHMSGFPEEWQQRLIEEAIFLMSVRASDEELFLSNELMNPTRKQKLEQEDSFDSAKALFLWAVYHDETARDAYLEKMTKACGMVPFSGARRAWIKVLQGL